MDSLGSGEASEEARERAWGRFKGGHVESYTLKGVLVSYIGDPRAPEADQLVFK